MNLFNLIQSEHGHVLHVAERFVGAYPDRALTQCNRTVNVGEHFLIDDLTDDDTRLICEPCLARVVRHVDWLAERRDRLVIHQQPLIDRIHQAALALIGGDQ